jgi:hypothetical protein
MKLKEILEKEISVSPEGEIKVLNEKEAIEYTDNDIIIHGKDEDIIIANKNVGAKIS